MCYIPENPVIWALIFMTGAAIGSFLNVVIYRWPRQESVIAPPSHCMSCGARLGVVDLFPVLSYLLLRGRCRHCHHGFSPRYAIVEAITGLLLVGSLGMFALSPMALAVFVICCCLLLVFFIDLDHMIIPDELVVIIAVIGVGINMAALARFGCVGPGPINATHALSFTHEIGGAAKTLCIPSSFVGMALGFGAFLLISWVSERAFGKQALGFGDVKLAGALGAVFGPSYLFVAWFLVSVVVGAVVSVAVMALGLRKRRDYIPFGPMLAIGGIVLLLFPEVAGFVIGLYGG